MKPKVLLPLALIIGGISWLAFSNLSKANYFYDVDQLPELGDKVYQKNLRIKGRIVAGSIQAKAKPVVFTIAETGQPLTVRYVGEEPLPDLFKDHAEAVVEGKMAADGVFEANHLQAKCASKYEAMAPEMTEGADPYSKPEQADTI